MNGEPRRASSSITGWQNLFDETCGVLQPRHGHKRPCRRCSGPTSPSPIRLKSCAAASGTSRRPSVRAKSETSSPSSSSSITTSPPRAAAARNPSSSSSAVRQTKTPLPAARPSALTTQGTRATVERRGGRNAGRAQDLLAERLRPLDARGLGAGAEHRDAVAPQLVADSRDERAFGPDHDQLGPIVEARPSSPSPSSARSGWQIPSVAMPGFPGAACNSVRLGLCASRQASACSRAPDPTSEHVHAASLPPRFPGAHSAARRVTLPPPLV